MTKTFLPKGIFAYIILAVCGITSCSDDSKEFLVESHEAKEFYSFDLPNSINAGGKLTIEFRFNYDKNSVSISGIPKEIWTQKGQSLILDLSKAQSEGISKVSWLVKFNEKAEEKDYNITMKGAEGYMDSSEIETHFELADGEIVERFEVTHSPFTQKFKLDVPTPGWLTIMYWVLVLGLLAGISYFILSRDNMPLGKKTFQRGKVIFLDVGAPVPSIKLDSLKDLSFDKYYPQLSGITLIPVDKRGRKKKRRVAKLTSKDATLKISIVNGTFKESFLGSGELYHMDRIEITMQDQKTIILEYTNSKNPRSYGI